jgi:hypothetical protein
MLSRESVGKSARRSNSASEKTMSAQIAAQSTRPVLDRAKLAGLKELIGEAKCAAAIQRFKGELFACLAAVEGNAPERAVHAHNLAGVAGLLGFDDLENESRRFLAALHKNREDVRTSAESLLQAAQRVELELDTIE